MLIDKREESSQLRVCEINWVAFEIVVKSEETWHA